MKRPTPSGLTLVTSSGVASQEYGQSEALKAEACAAGFQVASQTRPHTPVLRQVRPPVFLNSTQWVIVWPWRMTSVPPLLSRT